MTNILKSCEVNDNLEDDGAYLKCNESNTGVSEEKILERNSQDNVVSETINFKNQSENEE
jgi:hypothetical protein